MQCLLEILRTQKTGVRKELYGRHRNKQIVKFKILSDFLSTESEQMEVVVVVVENSLVATIDLDCT
jgi:hypothetical protein